jgi:hypothetical protein
MELSSMPVRLPINWPSEPELVAATGASPRNLTQWRGRGIVTGKRRFLGRGKGTTPCYYPPDTVRLIRRLYELQREIRDADKRVWELWVESFSADVRKWAMKRLECELKLVQGGEPERIAKAVTKAAKAKPRPADPGVFDRVRKPADRKATLAYVVAAFAGVEQQAGIYNAEPPIFEIVLKAIGIPRSMLAPTKLNLDQVSVPGFLGILATANDDELEQARRDWRTVARLVGYLGNAYWNAVGAELQAKIEALTKSRPAPLPSETVRPVNGARWRDRQSSISSSGEGFAAPGKAATLQSTKHDKVSKGGSHESFPPAEEDPSGHGLLLRSLGSPVGAELLGPRSR